MSDAPVTEEQAEPFIHELANSPFFTRRQAEAIVYGEIFKLSNQQAASLMDTSESNYRNLKSKTRDKAYDLDEGISALKGLTTTHVTPDIGGPAGDVLRRFDGQYIDCHVCEKYHRINADTDWEGRLHPDGIPDADNRKWWFHTQCPDDDRNSPYDMSLQSTIGYEPEDGIEEYYLVVRAGGTNQPRVKATLYPDDAQREAAAESIFYTTSVPGGDGEPLYYEVEERDGWREVRQSFAEYEELENLSLEYVGQGEDAVWTDAVTLRPPSHPDGNDVEVAVQFSQDAEAFIVLVRTGLRELYRREFTVADLPFTLEDT